MYRKPTVVMYAPLQHQQILTGLQQERIAPRHLSVRTVGHQSAVISASRRPLRPHAHLNPSPGSMQPAPHQQQGYPPPQHSSVPAYAPVADPYQQADGYQQPTYQAYPAPAPAGPYSYAAAVAQSGGAQGTGPAYQIPPPVAGLGGPPPAGYPGTNDMPQAAAAAADGAAAGDGSRGLGTMLMSTGHGMAHTGHQVHMLAHPGQYIKHHTVGKVRRKVHQAVDKALHKVGL